MQLSADIQFRELDIFISHLFNSEYIANQSKLDWVKLSVGLVVSNSLIERSIKKSWLCKCALCTALCSGLLIWWSSCISLSWVKYDNLFFFQIKLWFYVFTLMTQDLKCRGEGLLTLGEGTLWLFINYRKVQVLRYKDLSQTTVAMCLVDRGVYYS